MANENENKTTETMTIAKAIEHVYSKGNRNRVSKTLCTDLGITEFALNQYLNSVKQLYTELHNYVLLRNDGSSEPEKVEESRNKIFPLWKELLGIIGEVRCDSHDIEDLYLHVKSFITDESGEHVVTTNVLNRFQKGIEKELGFRMANKKPLDDPHRDYLRKLKRFDSKIKRLTDKIATIESSISFIREKIEGTKKPTIKELYSEEIREMEAEIEKIEAEIEVEKTAKVKFQAEHPDKTYVKDVKTAETK